MTNEFTEGENKDFTKVTFNVPVNLLNQFKTIADLNHYSRVAAMLEAMRQFVDDRTPEGYSEPDEIKTYWRQLMDAMLEISQDPKYAQLNPQQQQQMQQQMQDQHQQMINMPPPSEDEFRKKLSKK